MRTFKSQSMELKRDDIWGIYEDDARTLSEFIEKHVPKLQLRKDVSEDVGKNVSTIKKLLNHSFYEYEFIDLAYKELLHTFEMALKIRYQELNQKEWPKSKSLKDLIGWFRNKCYFEASNQRFFDQIRFVRNHFSHPKNYSLGGMAFLGRFNDITDLINDTYANIEERKTR